MIRRVVVVVLAGVFAVFLSAGTAWAHGGPIELQVQGDGAQGVNVTVTYVRDHHMVSEEVRLSYTAVSGTGDTVGPVPMVAANEGQIAPGGQLDRDGHRDTPVPGDDDDRHHLEEAPQDGSPGVGGQPDGGHRRDRGTGTAGGGSDRGGTDDPSSPARQSGLSFGVRSATVVRESQCAPTTSELPARRT